MNPLTESWEITTCGQSERFKGYLHLAIFGLAVTCGAYSLASLQVRPSRRLAVNAAVYLGLSAWEARQVLRHLERR